MARTPCGSGDGGLVQLDGLAVGGGVPQPVEEVLPARRVVRGHRVRHLVEVDPLDHPGEPEGVVAVEVGDADPVDVVRGDPGPQHLALGALAGVEEDALAVPAQQIAVVVAVPGGDLAGGAEHHQLAYGHGAGLRYPGGHWRPRPPRTCAWAWKTVW